MTAAVVAMLGCGGVLYTTMQGHETEQLIATTERLEKIEPTNIPGEGPDIMYCLPVENTSEELIYDTEDTEYHRDEEEVSRGVGRELYVKVTAYDLSVESCGKVPNEHGYGITASGVDLSGHSLESARAIAVDPDVIPLGSDVRISFNDPEWKHLDGWYKAVDTGGAVQGHHIDLFFGDSGSYYPDPILYDFGVRYATVEVLCEREY